MTTNHNATAADHVRSRVRWISACVVVAAMAAGLGALALAGGNLASSERAGESPPIEYKAEKPIERSGVFLAHEVLY